ncbi:hypothetical protein RXV86_04940 [Alisedimentitalea sp. MJ-SS2]|uniref:hypothetical protein n=1 Tax=Aliisedimentitalea sp. MJ-SS2 TaxID=3049795 RepID=UPI0029124571|nr:hypothetical protein [Alisedimentitalea sp. MJ-SS2]MDU8926725.1 hypothetical protein [Alisedimentitalea sp. MJ-SS2]
MLFAPRRQRPARITGHIVGALSMAALIAPLWTAPSHAQAQDIDPAALGAGLGVGANWQYRFLLERGGFLGVDQTGTPLFVQQNVHSVKQFPGYQITFADACNIGLVPTGGGAVIQFGGWMGMYEQNSFRPNTRCGRFEAANFDMIVQEMKTQHQHALDRIKNILR